MSLCLGFTCIKLTIETMVSVLPWHSLVSVSASLCYGLTFMSRLVMFLSRKSILQTIRVVSGTTLLNCGNRLRRCMTCICQFVTINAQFAFILAGSFVRCDVRGYEHLHVGPIMRSKTLGLLEYYRAD